jgi:hypothetical protein
MTTNVKYSANYDNSNINNMFLFLISKLFLCLKNTFIMAIFGSSAYKNYFNLIFKFHNLKVYFI